MKSRLSYFAAAMTFALAACGDSNTDSKPAANDSATKPAATADKSSMEKVTEAASKVAEALKLDTSSLEAFKSSLSDMKGSLSGSDQNKLMEALGSMVKEEAGKSEGGLMGAAKKAASDMASGKSLEDQLYEKVGDKLDGLTFEDILGMAG